MTDQPPHDDIPPLDRAKLHLERARLRTDMVKWIALSVGAVASFWIIDYGKLRLENFRATAEHERALLASYLEATDSATPDVWKRKLNLLIQLTQDENLRLWATKELVQIESFAALDALYRETLSVAAQLVDPNTLALQSRIEARRRYEQLYWADLPFAGESAAVEKGMVAFRTALMNVERQGPGGDWQRLNASLIKLSRTLRDASEALRASGATAPVSLLK
jgi:hypothetical protein